MFLHDGCRDVVQRLVKIQSRQSKQKLEDVKLLANENDEGNEIDDAETTKKSKKRRKIGNSGLNEDDLLEYDMNMLLDRDDPRRGTDENLDTMSNMSEFNAAPSGSRGVSGGNNQFYLRDEEVLQWAKNAGDSDNNDVVVSKHKSNKRLQLEKSRKAKLDLDDEDMMFRLGYGGHIDDDDDLSGDDEARERKRQRALCMENNNDDDDQILMPIPDEGSEDEDQQGFMAIPMNESEEEKAFLEPAFQSQKEQEQREERFHLGLRETNALVRPRQKRPKVARLANQRAIIFDQQTRIENNEYKSWLKNCDDILCDRPRKEIPIDEMDIHLMNDEKALSLALPSNRFSNWTRIFLPKRQSMEKVRSDVVPKLQIESELCAHSWRRHLSSTTRSQATPSRRGVYHRRRRQRIQRSTSLGRRRRGELSQIRRH